MQNVSLKRFAGKIISSLVALALVLQPIAVGATAVDSSWLNSNPAGNITIGNTGTTLGGTQTSTANSTVTIATGVVRPVVSIFDIAPTALDVKTQTLVTKFNLDDQANLMVIVRTSAGATVYTGTVSLSNTRAGFNQYNYAGTRTDGVAGLITDGQYSISIYSQNSIGTGLDARTFTVYNNPVAAPVTTTTTTTVTSTPMFSGVSFIPNPFYVQSQNATVSFNLSTSGLVKLFILNTSGTTVYSSAMLSKNAGANSIVYQGYDNANALLAAGMYTYQLQSYTTSNVYSDSATGSVQVINPTGTVIVNPPVSTVPYLSNVSFSPNPFYVQSQNGTASFTLAADGCVKLVVLNAQGSAVYTGSQTCKTAGSNSIAYNGTSDNGSFLPQGAYTYQIYSYTNGGVYADMKTGSFQVLYAAAPVVQDYISSYSFTPSSFDPRYSTSTVSFTLNTSVSVDFRVQDSNGVLRYSRTNVYPVGFNSFTYDGRDNNGNYLTAGTYTYKLVINKGNGVIETKQGTFYITGQDVIVPPVSQVPTIYNQYATPNPYNPMAGSLTISYSVSPSAYVSVSVLLNGTPIRTLKGSMYESGSNSAMWDGRLLGGAFAAPGIYTYTITANNSYGSAVPVQGTFTIGTTGGYVVPVNQGTCGGFSDVYASSAYCTAIQEMLRMGIFSGYSDGTFRPNAPINRAETVKVVMLALKYNVPTSGWFWDRAGFTDVSATSWFTPYLAAARIYRVINGYPDNSFRPANTVNRVEMLRIFLEAANIGNDGSAQCYRPYADNTSGKWFSGYACTAFRYTLVDSINGKLMAANAMTRGDVALMIYRAQVLGLLNNLPPKTQVTLPQIPANMQGMGIFQTGVLPDPTNVSYGVNTSIYQTTGTTYTNYTNAYVNPYQQYYSQQQVVQY